MSRSRSSISKLDVMFGRRPVSEMRHPYRSIHKPGVTFRQETVVVAKFTAPTAELFKEKQKWGATRAARWFGS